MLTRLIPRLAVCGLLFTGLSACSDMDMPNLPAVQAASLQSLQMGDFDAGLGSSLASYARTQASGGTGYCYQAVAQDIHGFMPAFLTGMHAYQAADQLAASPRFREVGLSAQQLPSLPAGAVVVWDKGQSESGHISIADGQGNEISDHIAPQMTAHYGGGGFRVFLPR